MSENEKQYKRRWGDRRDGRRIKMPGLQTVMSTLMPNRADCEVFLKDTIDVTEILAYLEKKNAQDPTMKRTFFHCVVAMAARMVRERPVLNRFVQGARIYERFEISIAFVAKRKFAENAEEALLFFVPKDTDTLDDVTKMVVGEVTEMRKSEHATGGVDELLDIFASMPRLLMMFLIRIIRWLDFWGINPKFLTDGDPNYSTIFLSNLGSIQCPAVYHHLNNYGTNSIMITIGTIHEEEKLMPDHSKEIRKVVDLGVTIDERIGDGFYFARSLKLLHYICAHPELLDRPIGEDSGFDYK